jgi:hypothetical protein
MADGRWQKGDKEDKKDKGEVKTSFLLNSLLIADKRKVN